METGIEGSKNLKQNLQSCPSGFSQKSRDFTSFPVVRDFLKEVNSLASRKQILTLNVEVNPKINATRKGKRKKQLAKVRAMKIARKKQKEV